MIAKGSGACAASEVQLSNFLPGAGPPKGPPPRPGVLSFLPGADPPKDPPPRPGFSQLPHRGGPSAGSAPEAGVLSSRGPDHPSLRTEAHWIELDGDDADDDAGAARGFEP